MDDRRFEFRFLSGSNIGASLVLLQGEYILGNTDKSDIVIYDNAIEKSELKLFLTEEGVFAEALSGNWLINNSQLKGKQSLPSGDLLSVGLNTLAWHKEGDPFAAFTSFSVKETGSGITATDAARIEATVTSKESVFWFSVDAVTTAVPSASAVKTPFSTETMSFGSALQLTVASAASFGMISAVRETFFPMYSSVGGLRILIDSGEISGATGGSGHPI